MLVVTILLLATAEALAADGGAGDAGVDAGADGGTDTDTETCEGACVEEFYNECACGPDDLCEWAGDGVCDEACVLQGYVDEMFDDSVDCDPVPDGGTDTDTDTDTDADTDTSTDTDLDASTDGSSASACSCAAIGKGGTSWLLAFLSRLF